MSNSKHFFPLSSGKTAWNNTLNPVWTVTDQTAASGKYRAYTSQLLPKYTFSVTFPALRQGELDSLLGFYNEMRGSFTPFFYEDFSRHRVEDQTLAPGTDGKYQLIIPIGNYAEQAYEVHNVTVTLDGTPTSNFSITDGKLTIDAGGKTVKASYDYYWRVRFADAIVITELFYGIYKVTCKFTTAR